MALTDKDVDKLITRMQGVFSTKEDVKAIRADIAVINSDLTGHDNRYDEQIRSVSEIEDRLNLLMTKNEAIHLFDMATMKTQLDHLRKLAREKWGVEV